MGTTWEESVKDSRLQGSDSNKRKAARGRGNPTKRNESYATQGSKRTRRERKKGEKKSVGIGS